jgi:N,N-dimethylformamidase
MKLVGYSNRWSLRPGEEIAFHIHCANDRYEVQLVRLIHGDQSPRGPGFKEEPLDSPLNGSHDGYPHAIRKGSYGIVDAGAWASAINDFTLLAWIWPTRPDGGVQGIVARWNDSDWRGFGLFIGPAGELELRLGKEGASVASGCPLRRREWYFVAASYEQVSGRACLLQIPSRFTTLEPMQLERQMTIGGAALDAPGAPLLFGAGWLGATPEGPQPHAVYNGKIAAPCLLDRALSFEECVQARDGRELDGLVGDWAFAIGIPTTRIHDRSPHGRHGRTVNRPTRAVTGPRWTGDAPGLSQASHEYDAIHFHDDDITDAGWPASHVFTAPQGMRSGIYALRLRSGDAEDYLPFFVCPPKCRPTARIALLMPTLSYLAYANESLDVSGILQLAPLQDMRLREEEYRYMAANGLKSTYDLHSDGSGVCYSSLLHPILDFRPKARCRTFNAPHQFPADLNIVDWLEAKRFEFDVITDHELDAEGVDLLRGYKVVLTGSHPEYWTRAMLDALGAYLDSGGRLMYLGGNGFYWVTAIDPADPTLIEVRRFVGTRTWQGEPGECQISVTGEMGGLWRDRGRAPQRIVGVGFTGQGFDRGSPYRRLPASYDPAVAFVFKGIEGELIGEGPSLVLNHGAAGFEVDKVDATLGTPAHALVLASSFYHSDAYQFVVEETLNNTPWSGGSLNRRLGADMVFLEYPNGGAVFSVGSICWSATLSFEAYGSDTSRITENVLRAFERETYR